MIEIADGGLSLVVPRELVLAALALGLAGRLEAAQLDAPDLARDRLGQAGELDLAHSLVGRKPCAHELEDLAAERARRLVAGSERDERLGHRRAYRIGRWPHGG